MIEQKKIFNELHKNEIKFYTGVPDSLLNEFCKYLDTEIDKNNHIIAANEGNAIAIASGYHLATDKIPLVYMQNSGMGNALNPLASLVDKDVYSIPMILLIGWRGDPNITDHCQHNMQGQITPKILDNLDIPYQVMENDYCDYAEIIKWASTRAKESSLPTAIIVKKGVLEQGKSQEVYPENDKYELTRNEAIEIILDNLPKDTIYVASTGRITRELYWLREKKGQSHKNDILNVGAMGHTSSIALGLAIANPKNKIVCLDGDAAAIMHLGAMAIIGDRKPKNLIHVVLNNGSHESVGGQNSVAFNIDLTAIAKNCGYEIIDDKCDTKEKIVNAINRIKNSNELGFLEIFVKKGMLGKLPSLEIDTLLDKEDFMKSLKDDAI